MSETVYIYIFFLNSIIATPSAYGSRYAGCCYSIVLCLALYIAGFCHPRRPLFYQCGGVVDLNWSISPSDFMNWAAFLANLGRVSISSQHILPNAALLLSPSHVLFLFPVCIRHSTKRCFADCIPRLQGHSGESKPGTFRECKNFLRPIFSVLI